jgi:hypothetical protein
MVRLWACVSLVMFILCFDTLDYSTSKSFNIET